LGDLEVGQFEVRIVELLDVETHTGEHGFGVAIQVAKDHRDVDKGAHPEETPGLAATGLCSKSEDTHN